MGLKTEEEGEVIKEVPPPLPLLIPEVLLLMLARGRGVGVTGPG